MRKLLISLIFLGLLKAGAVVSDNHYATEAGAKILQMGGNAVDAAVAVGFALAVTYPSAGNIGGGGFMIIWDGKRAYFLDYRETAPTGARKDMFIRNGKFQPELSTVGALAAGVPGTVAGLLEAHRRFGKLPLRVVMAPAIDLAERGFRLTTFQARRFERKAKLLSRFPETRKIFLPGGRPPAPGYILVQKDLARTLKLIAQRGRDGFYRGRTAKLIERTMKKWGGLITAKDLASYQPKWREPEEFSFLGRKVYCSSLPSSGGLILRTVLGAMEVLKPEIRDVYYYHALVETMKFAFYDRAKFMGDADFSKIPIQGLRSRDYLMERLKLIRLLSPLDGSKFNFNPWAFEKKETTHFSVFDGKMAVSNTYTINGLFGSGLVVEGAGFLLNNEMDDFTTPGAANQFGALGSPANYIQEGKRMLSSMSPTIVVREGKVEAVLGSPGGTTIPSAVAQVILNLYLFQMDPWEAVASPRLHHQWWPDVVFAGRGFDPGIIQGLQRMGYRVKVRAPIGDVNGIYLWKGRYYPIPDPRGDGKGARAEAKLGAYEGLILSGKKPR